MLFEKYYPREIFKDQTSRQYVENLTDSVSKFYAQKLIGWPIMETPDLWKGTSFL